MPKQTKKSSGSFFSFSKVLIALVVAGIFTLGIVVVSNTSDETSSTQTSPNAITQGQKVYARSCASCHGGDLRGTGRGLPIFRGSTNLVITVTNRLGWQ